MLHTHYPGGFMKNNRFTVLFILVFLLPTYLWSMEDDFSKEYTEIEYTGINAADSLMSYSSFFNTHNSSNTRDSFSDTQEDKTPKTPTYELFSTIEQGNYDIFRKLLVNPKIDFSLKKKDNFENFTQLHANPEIDFTFQKDSNNILATLVKSRRSEHHISMLTLLLKIDSVKKLINEKIPQPQSEKKTTLTHLLVESINFNSSELGLAYAGLLLEILIANGSNLLCADGTGKNTIALAQEKGYDALVDFLKFTLSGSKLPQKKQKSASRCVIS